jgi:hypothetical protein
VGKNPQVGRMQRRTNKTKVTKLIKLIKVVKQIKQIKVEREIKVEKMQKIQRKNLLKKNLRNKNQSQLTKRNKTFQLTYLVDDYLDISNIYLPIKKILILPKKYSFII